MAKPNHLQLQLLKAVQAVLLAANTDAGNRVRVEGLNNLPTSALPAIEIEVSDEEVDRRTFGFGGRATLQRDLVVEVGCLVKGASAMGKDLMQMIEAVADASTGEFERLKEFGVKSSKEGENVKFTFQGVTTTVRNSSEEITAYLESIGNNQFASAMSERAKTLDGAIAALGDSWDELFRTVNQNNTGGFIYDSVTLANGALEDLNTILQASNGVMSDGATAGGAYKTVQEGLATVFETVAVLGTNVKYVLTGVGTELGGLAAQAAAVLRGDFAGAAEIRRQMVTDAENARIKVDAQTEAILSARKRAADAIAAKPAAGSDLAALADSVNGYKPQTVTDASLKGMADSLLKSSVGFKSAAESMGDPIEKRRMQAEFNAAQWEFANPFLQQTWIASGGTLEGLEDLFRLAVTK